VSEVRATFVDWELELSHLLSASAGLLALAGGIRPRS
jgi:hypothetical protein